VCVDVTRAVKHTRFDDLAKTDLLDPTMDSVGSAGLFEGRLEHAIFQFGAMVQAVRITENCNHSAHPLL
jgi:hypothetical protein